MRPARTYSVFILMAALLLASLPFEGTAKSIGHQGSAPDSAVLFAVSGMQGPDGYITPFVLIEQGQFKQPVAGDSDAAEITKFSDAYYAKGRKYRVLFGGGAAGSLTIKKSEKDAECSRTSADVTLRTQAKLNRNVMALATNSESLGAANGTRRAPTAAERASLMPLVKAAFREKGVPASLLPSLVTVNLTALDLDNDGKAELIGSFVVKKQRGGAARHALFLIAEPQGESYRTTTLQYEQFTQKDIMSGATLSVVEEGVYLERLIDGLDLDGDKASEVITLIQGLEGDGYLIYKKQNGKWEKVYDFSNYRCAF